MSFEDESAAQRWWEQQQTRRQIQIYRFLGPRKRPTRTEIPGQLTIDGEEIRGDLQED